MRVMIRHDEFERINLSLLTYYLCEGFAVDLIAYKVKKKHVNIYFHSPFKNQREVVQCLQRLGIDTHY